MEKLCTGPELSVDLTTEILTRVPVKPLLRFRCVSKHFCALIDSSFFVNKNFKHLSTSNRRLVLSNNIQPCIYSAPFEINKDYSKLTVVSLDSPLKHYSSSAIRILGSCNGLVCLKTDEQQKLPIVFWNPSTGKHWNLRSNKSPANASSTKYNYGFGYVSQSNDYKLVSIHQPYNKSSSNMFLSPEVDVYSLRSNLWRRSKCIPHGNVLLSCDKYGVLVNEGLHWPITKPLPSHPYDLVVAFELESESFRMISLPKVEVTNVSMSIHVLDGWLCASYQCDDVGFEVWVMKKYGVKESWTKLFTIDHAHVWDKWVPIAYTSNDDKVFLRRSRGVSERIMSYDLVRKRIKNVGIQGMPRLFSVMAYSESLVDPNDKCLHDRKSKHGQKKARRSWRKRMVN